MGNWRLDHHGSEPNDHGEHRSGWLPSDHQQRDWTRRVWSRTGIFQPRFSGSGFNFALNIDIVNGASGSTLLQSYNTTGTTQTFSGTIGGSGSYKRNASTGGTGGETVFAGANTYSGGTSISEGALTATNTSGSATGPGAITINSNGILNVGNGG